MARSSAGGQVVIDSLAAVGLENLGPRTSLVETTTQRRLDVVLVQNAWNVVESATFKRLLARYPRKWRRRAIGRRALAQVNLRRAGKVVCLTEAVAEMCRTSAGVLPVVTPVAMPLHDWRPPSEGASEVNSRALVVGTVTWYKRPALAMEVVSKHFPAIDSMLFLGGDDGSGAWEDVRRRADSLGMRVERTVVSHSEIYQYYRESRVTLLASALESLGFGVMEAMSHAPRVLASDIPAHRDAARAMGGWSPEWITADGKLLPAAVSGGIRPSRDEVERQWRRVAEEMHP